MNRILILLLALITSGCTHAISQQGREGVNNNMDYATVKANPGAHTGETILLGGVIVGLEVEQKGSTIEVYRWKLDRWGEPYEIDEDSGRFLAETDRWLDPAVYTPGRLVSMAATVSGQVTRLLGQIDYNYPVFRIKESHVWQTPYRYMLYPGGNVYAPTYVAPQDPTRDNPYDPGYYPYPYSPYYLRFPR